MCNWFDISGRAALVTGSNRGLGLALATGLAKAGARVTLQGRDATKVSQAAQQLSESLGAPVGHLVFDVTDAQEAERALNDFMDSQGTPDILVNNAGIQRRHPITEFPTEEWDAVISTNLSSVFYVTKPVAQRMVERGSGKVVMVGSVQSRLARQTIAPYCASKGGVAMFVQGLAADLSRYNIQVNTLSPGYFATEMNTDLWQDPQFDAWLKARTPAGRWGKFDELMGTLIYLSSEASNFVTGQNILVDGGMTSVV